MNDNGIGRDGGDSLSPANTSFLVSTHVRINVHDNSILQIRSQVSRKAGSTISQVGSTGLRIPIANTTSYLPSSRDCCRPEVLLRNKSACLFFESAAEN